MSEYRMPEPPEGCFWRVRVLDDSFGIYVVAVELRKPRTRFGDRLIARERFIDRSRFSPEDRAEWAVRCAETIMEKIAQQKAREAGLDFNGLQGAELGYGVTGDVKRALERHAVA